MPLLVYYLVAKGHFCAITNASQPNTGTQQCRNKLQSRSPRMPASRCPIPSQFNSILVINSHAEPLGLNFSGMNVYHYHIAQQTANRPSSPTPAWAKLSIAMAPKMAALIAPIICTSGEACKLLLTVTAS